jgi:cytochrome c556
MQSQALAKAFKSADPAAVKDTANKLNASCTNCHGKFRD